MKRLIIWIMISVPLFLFGEVRSAEIDNNMGIFFDVMKQLDMHYVDSLDYKDLVETAISQMLRKVDPYTVYYPASKDVDLRMMATGKYGGIGATVMQREVSENDTTKVKWVFVTDPQEGMPAQLVGVEAGDKILSVDGKDMKGKSVKEVSEALRGASETKIHLVLERDGVDTPIEKDFLRKDIKLPSLPFYTDIDGIGYIVFSEFTEHSSQRFKEAVDDLVQNQQSKVLVIDLRNNGGGIIDEAIRIVGNFVPRGTLIVETRGKAADNKREYRTTQIPTYPDIPIFVLINKNSASASEIVSGSLQDLKRATIMGERSFGKGLVQAVRPLSHDGHIKVTTAHYYLPSGRCIQKIDYAHREKDNSEGGIQPDIELKDSSKVDISYDLYTQHYIFDFATKYHRTHDTISSAKDFCVSQADIDSFCNFLDEKKYVYHTETSKFFDNLLRVARQEDTDTTTYGILFRLKDEISPSFRSSIAQHRTSVEKLLNAEIVKRYYFQKGVTMNQMQYDKVLLQVFDKARETFQSTNLKKKK